MGQARARVGQGVAGDRGAVVRARLEGDEGAPGAGGGCVHVGGGVGAVAHDEPDGALDDAVGVPGGVHDPVDDGHLAVEARGGGDVEGGSLRVGRAPAHLHGGGGNAQRGGGEGVDRVLGDVDGLGDAGPGGLDDGLGDLGQRPGRGHNGDGHLRLDRAGAVVDGDRQRARRALLVGGGLDGQDVPVQGRGHAVGDAGDGVAEGGRVGAVGVADHEGQVLGDRVLPDGDPDGRGLEDGRGVAGGVNPQGQGQGRRQRRVVVGGAVAHREGHRGPPRVVGGHVEGDVGLVGQGDAGVHAGGGRHGGRVGDAGGAPGAGEHVVAHVEDHVLPGAHGHRDAGGVQDGAGQVGPGHGHDGGGAQPVGVGDGVDHQAAPLAGGDEQLVAGHGHPLAAGGDRQPGAVRVRVLVIGQDVHAHGAVRGQVGQGHGVVAGEGRLEGGVGVDVDGQGAAGDAPARVGDAVGDEVGALPGGRVQGDVGAGGGGLQGVVGDLERVGHQGDGVAVGVQVVAGDIDRQAPVGPGAHDVVLGDGRLVVLAGRGHPHAHAGDRLLALAVLDDVGEHVGPARAGGRRGVLQPLGAQLDRAPGRGLLDAHQRHRVAVGVDAAQRHGYAGGLPADGPGGQGLRPGRGVGLPGGHDLEGDGGGGRVPGGVADGVGHLERAGARPGLQAHQVAGDEGGADGAVGGVDELGVHGQGQSRRGGVIGQDVDPADVADADPGRVRLELGRALVVLGGGRHDGDAGGGAGLAVGDRVGHRDGGVEACRGAHAQQVAVQEGDLQVVGDLDALHHEHPAGRVGVVGQWGHERRAAGGQDAQVVLGHGHGLGVHGDDVDPDDAQGGGRPVGDGVGELVGAGHRRGEGDGAQGQVRGQGGALRGDRQGHQAQGVAVGVGVVGQGLEGEGLAAAGHVEVGVGGGRDVAGVAHVDGQGPGGGLAAVGDDDGDGPGPGPAAQVVQRDGAVLVGAHLQALGAGGGHEVDLVAVGVDPVGQDVVVDLGVGAQLDRGVAQLGGALVLAPGVDGDGDGGGVDGPPVRGLVGEGGRAGAVVLDAGELEGAPAAGGGDGAEARLGGGGGGQDVAVGVGVVLEHGQGGGAPGPHAEGVVDGVGRGVLLVALGVGDLVGGVRGVLEVLLLGELLVDLVPVVHEDHVLVGQPHRARAGAVEDDAGPVGAEDDVGAGGGERVHRHVGGGGGVVAHAPVGARAGPGGVVAAPVAHRGRGHAGVAAGGRLNRGDLPAVQGHGQQGGGRGDEDGVGVGAGRLEDRAGAHALGAQVAHGAVGQDEGAGVGGQGHGPVTDGGQGQGGGLRQAGDRRGLGRVDAPAWLHDDEAARGGGHGHDRAVGGGGHGPAVHVGGHGGGGGEGRGGGRGGGGDPQVALVGVEHADAIAPLDGHGGVGQGDGGAHGDLGDGDGGDGAGDEVGQGDGLAGLADVEVRGVGAQRGVQGARVVVEVAHQLAGLVGDPDAAVVDVDLRGGHAPVGHGQAGDDEGDDDDRDGGQAPRQAPRRAGAGGPGGGLRAGPGGGHGHLPHGFEAGVLGGRDEYAAIIVHRGGAGPVGRGRDRARAARAGRAGAAVREIAG